MVRARLLEPQPPMMQVHVPWQIASAPGPFRTRNKVAILGPLTERSGKAKPNSLNAAVDPSAGYSRLSALRSTRLEGSAFGVYSHRLVARGLKKGKALIAVKREMLIIAVHLLKTEEEYDPAKVSVVPASWPPG